MKFTVIIPARYASTRFPGKPLAEIAGKPMVAWVAAQAVRSGAAQVLVATDDTRIADAARAHGYDVAMTRANHASGTDRLAEVVRSRRFSDGEIVVNVQGDEPLIEPALIRRVAEKLAAERSAAIATACHPIKDHRELVNPNVVKVVLDEKKHALYFSRAPVPYARDAFSRGSRSVPAGLPVFRHLGIYAYRCGFLRAFQKMKPVAIEAFEALEQLRALAHGYGIAVVVSRAAPHGGVDTPADLARVRRLVAAKNPRRTRV